MSSETPSSPVYAVVAHPNWRGSHVNHQLRHAAATTPGVALCDLYERYPDYAIDVPAEQARLSAARLLVLVYPVQWYSMPALLKLWLDEVFSYGWAYGHGAKAMQGKDLWLVLSTGGSEASYHPEGYNRYFFDAFLTPYEQTAALCGMRFLPPMVLHGAHSATPAEIERHAATFAERLRTYPQWPELADSASCAACDVPDADRPADSTQGGH
ncbi:NAD(P)H-dependent oxidoreductase [Curvibacter sp. CHRR-16]|uniref:glutathione-regulated potassium-efflux system oxidoreductase KefF n=1 Tax=Curvibacter sp. CHRR-16 TaxID=2835872 RepID=UPI001BD92E26|nr:NAD(P)H-dependent oxidoreductase [Curvibacter sp. CHRR-16]MBT0570692.1 NAD(P)H-dependent oxidoreductase [Curvibacter sp. CHRR-16]